MNGVLCRGGIGASERHYNFINGQLQLNAEKTRWVANGLGKKAINLCMISLIARLLFFQLF